MSTRTSPGTWRASEDTAIEAEFEGKPAQIFSAARTTWGQPDGGKNKRFRATRAADMAFVEIADHHFDAMEKALRELCETSLDTEIVMDHARAILRAIDEERAKP